MIHTEIANLLKETMGIDSSAIGSSTILRAVQNRQTACKLLDVQAYLNHLRSSAAELFDLIEAVVVPETWFFRHHEAFVELARIAYENWLRSRATGVLRLLSLPCSTGEEPYSMAMALLDVGLPADRFQIDAVDISERVLALARRGEYGKNSFRGKDLAFRDRYFELTDGRWRINDRARSQVRFQQGNVFVEAILPAKDVYDIIFCRNMLIYFDSTAQAQVITVMGRLLKSKGTLFVGPSETALMLTQNYVSAKVPRTFAFHKSAPAGVRIAARTSSPIRVPSPSRHIPMRPQFRKEATSPVKPFPVFLDKDVKTTPLSGMAEAAMLADLGRLLEAEQCCSEHMCKHGASAEALYLLGLIRDAGGNLAEAAHYYRQALYLDQNHYEAMSQLALLLRNQGNIPASRLLLGRMTRNNLQRTR